MARTWNEHSEFTEPQKVSVSAVIATTKRAELQRLAAKRKLTVSALLGELIDDYVRRYGDEE